MTVETAPFINSLDATLPTNAQLKSEGDDHIRTIKAAVKATLPNLTGAVTATQAELNHVVGVTAPIQTQIDQATALATSQAASASSTTSLTIGTGDKAFTMQAGRNLIAGQVQLSISSTASPANWMTGTLTSYNNTTGAAVVTVTNTGGAGTFADWTIGVIGGAGMSGLVNELKGADIASAASINLDNATGNLVHITGTATISTMTLAAGRRRTLVFDGACTLTHSATLKCPGDTSITTAAGDMVTVYGDGSAVLLTDYQTKSGKPLTSGSYIFTSSGTFTLPAGATTVVVDLFGAGGGGGGASGGAAGTVRKGGGGGGGGAHVRLVLAASAITSAVTVQVGAGGTGGGEGGTDGGTGGNSSFGSFGVAYGGSGGREGGGTGNGGGGGGAASAGVSGNPGTGGSPSLIGGHASQIHNIGAGGACGGISAQGGGNAEWGGGGGGGAGGSGEQGGAGGSAVFGGCGGGAGGGLSTGNVATVGVGGGAPQTYTAAGNGVSGVSLNGGKGGNANASGMGAAGELGGVAGGGGGGGASGPTYPGAAGGAGGRGEVLVYWY